MLVLAFLVLLIIAALLVAMEPIHTYADEELSRASDPVDGLDADTREALT